MLTGEGYSLMWPEGDEPRRYDCSRAMIVPRNVFHQHFIRNDPARYLAFSTSDLDPHLQASESLDQRRTGGDQVDYATKPAIPRLHRGVAKHGMTRNGRGLQRRVVAAAPGVREAGARSCAVRICGTIQRRRLFG